MFNIKDKVRNIHNLLSICMTTHKPNNILYNQSIEI